MKAKLTLRMDERLIERAKRHARRQGTSVSQMVADYFALLQEPSEARPSAKETRRLIPAGYAYSEFTKSLTGAFGEAEDRVDYEDAYRQQTTTPSSTAIIFGSDNVFADLGFSDEEAAHLRVRSLLLQRLQAYVQDEGLTQEAAADRLGVHPSRVSQLMRGKIGAFSIDALVNMLAVAGVRVRVAFEPVA